MALKRTSSPIAISTTSQLTADPAAGQFVSKAVDLQLNPLDNEVFVVTALKIDFEDGMPIPFIAAPGAFKLNQKLSISTTAQTSYSGISASNVLGASGLSYYLLADTVNNFFLYEMQEDNAMDTPPADQEYIGIIATNDFFVNYACSDTLAVQTLNANIRVYGYRAKADASTYAALVQSEVLSS
jgi:hypothetical protein